MVMPSELVSTPSGDLDEQEGALMEMAAWPGISSALRTIYLTLAIRPALDLDVLAQVAGVVTSTAQRNERYLISLHLIDPITRTILYPRTGVRT